MFLDIIKVHLQNPCTVLPEIYWVSTTYPEKQPKRRWEGSRGDRYMGRRRMQWSGTGHTQSLKVTAKYLSSHRKVTKAWKLYTTPVMRRGWQGTKKPGLNTAAGVTTTTSTSSPSSSDSDDFLFSFLPISRLAHIQLSQQLDFCSKLCSTINSSVGTPCKTGGLLSTVS